MSQSEKPQIQVVVDGFLTDLAGIRSNAIFTEFIIRGLVLKTGRQFKEFYEKELTPLQNSTDRTVPPEKVRHFKRLEYEVNRALRGRAIASRGFIVSLVSQYDAFISGLVRALFSAQPSLIQASKKTIDVSELFTFTSIEEAKDSVIDDEIEGLLRESHAQQFTWLENKFGIKTLRKDLDVWPAFVELTQRRNLFVHSDGKVSKQYLKMCAEHGIKVEKITVSSELDADLSYVRQGADILFEIAVKLSQVLWRKTQPKDLARADEALNNVAYSLLERKRYKLAIRILDFAFETIKKYSSNDSRLQLLVNRANAYRLNGETQKCLDLISLEDWSASNLKFRLAVSVLRNEVAEIVRYMHSIGISGDVSKSAYRDWPLFEGLRENPAFTDAFREIFGEEMSIPEVIKPPRENDDLSSDEKPLFLDSFDTDQSFELDFRITTNE